MNTETKTSTAPDLSNTVLADVILSVGRKIWLIPRSYGRNREEAPIEVTITKVGRKFFKVDGYYERFRFDIETLREVDGSGMCYLELQHILDNREKGRLLNKLRSVFSSFGKSDLTLDQLRAIDNVLTS